MSKHLILALVVLAASTAAACTSEPAAPAPRTEAPRSDTDRESTTLYGLDVVDAKTAFAFGLNDYDFTGSIVLKTSDGGETWRSVLHADRSEFVGLDFADANKGVAITDGGAAFVTSDGGETWTAVSDSTLFERRYQAPSPAIGAPTAPQSGPVELAGIFFAGALDGWTFGSRDESKPGAAPNRLDTVTRPVVVRTSDGGATWKELTVPAEAPAVAFRRGFFADAKSGVLVGGDIDDETGVVARTSDGGATWSIVTPASKQIPTDVFFVDASRGWLVGFTEDASGDAGPTDILTTADGGQTWTVQSRVPTSLRAIRFADPQNGWAVGARGKIFRTTDGGATWVEQSTQNWTTGKTVEVEDPLFGDDDSPTFAGFQLLTPNRGWAAGDVGVYEYKGR